MEQQELNMTTPPVKPAPSSPQILVVDDERSIQKVLEGVLTDAGYTCSFADNGIEALKLLESEDVKPALVILDIWMPGLDGLETLTRIHDLYPDLPVVMISGHATIATAVQATRMGASDFIEKPLDIDAVLSSVQRALCTVDPDCEVAKEEDTEVRETLRKVSVRFSKDRDPKVLENQTLTGKNYRQRTLAHSAIVYGTGLHSGTKSGLMLEPLPAGSGIHFVGVSETTAVPSHVNFVESTGFATTLKLGNNQVSTIEHLLSALHAYKISNLLIKCNDEVPVLDGSALEFCKLIEETGIEEQDADWFSIKVEETIRVGNDKEYIQIGPAEGFTVDYTLDYPAPLGKQHFVFTLDDPESYKKEIAPARTFGFVKDIGHLQKLGLAQGGRFDNFVLYGDEGAINDELRFPNEAVRHKILDAIGDLFLLGRPLEGKITASMTGHSDNIDLIKQISKHL